MPLFKESNRTITKYSMKSLAKIRMEKGLSIRALADRLELSPTYVSMLETGERTVAPEMARFIDERLYKLKITDRRQFN